MATSQISYDDILSSLNMTVVDGRLVIVRNFDQEKKKKMQKIEEEEEPVVAPVPVSTPVSSLEMMKEMLQKKRQKKMFMQEVTTNNTPAKMEFKKF
jgi:CO dehydrogenase nickel-insertion accessory protein CooC1